MSAEQNRDRFQGEIALKDGISLPTRDEGRLREFVIVSALISVVCLVLVVRERLGVNDLFTVPIFRHLFIAHDYVGALATMGALALAFLLRGTGPVVTVVSMLGRHPVVTATTTFMALCAGALFAYHNHPLSLDEYSALLQSEAFAAGRLTGQFPLPLMEWLIPFGFHNNFLAASPQTGQVASIYMPGFALLLTPFVYFGVPWACNPALAAASLLVIRQIARELTNDDEAGGWAMLFALASPAFSINAMSYYSMTSHLLVNALYSLLLLRPTPLKALCAGVIGSLALALHSPFPHAVYAAPWIAWLAFKREFRYLWPLLLGYLPLGLGLVGGWMSLLQNLSRQASDSNTANVIAATAQTAWSGWVNAVGAIVRLPDMDIVRARLIGAAKLWVWAVPGLPVLAWWGFLTGKQDVRYQLLLASAVTTFFAYFFIPFDQGHGWGYRYFHSAWGVLPVLGAVAVVSGSKAQTSERTLWKLVGYAAVASLLIGTTLRTFQVHDFVERHMDQVPAAIAGKRQVLFIDIRCGYYTVDLVQNHALLRSKVLMMMSHGPRRNVELARQLSTTAHLVTKKACGELWSLE